MAPLEQPRSSLRLLALGPSRCAHLDGGLRLPGAATKGRNWQKKPPLWDQTFTLEWSHAAALVIKMARTSEAGLLPL